LYISLITGNFIIIISRDLFYSHFPEDLIIKTMKYTLLTNGKIINNRTVTRGDLLIGNERIMQVGGRINAPTPDTHVINLKNKYILPGLIHYNCPILRNGENEATSAIYIALSHGATFLLDTLRMKENHDFADSIMFARESCLPIVADYSIHIGASSCSNLTHQELSKCYILEGITSFMIQWKDIEKITSGDLNKLMDLAARFKLLLICDTSTVKKSQLIGKSLFVNAYLAKLEQIAKYALEKNTPILFTNIASHDELNALFSKIGKRGIIYAAINLNNPPQNMENRISYDDLTSLYENSDIILNPPELITPNSNHFIENSKSPSFLQEIVGETTPSSDAISMLCDLYAGRTAKLLGVYPQKGSLNPGSDADIIIWNPLDAEFTRETGSNTSLLRKDIWGVILNGELISEDQLMLSNTFNGRYIYRNSIIEEGEPETIHGIF
jgi:dihydropyrimidinase